MAVDMTEHPVNDILILKFAGRLDAAASPMMERKIVDLIEKGHTKLIMNFAGVDYLSSAGMRLLLSVSKRLQDKTGKLVLAAVHPDVMEVIQMAGFDALLTIVEQESEAIEAF